MFLLAHDEYRARGAANDHFADAGGGGRFSGSPSRAHDNQINVEVPGCLNDFGVGHAGANKGHRDMLDVCDAFTKFVELGPRLVQKFLIGILPADWTITVIGLTEDWFDYMKQCQGGAGSPGKGSCVQKSVPGFGRKIYRHQYL